MMICKYIRTYIFFLFSVILCFGWMQQARSHEDHGTSFAQPQKGGVLKPMGDYYIELVQIYDQMRVYVYDHDLHLVPVDQHSWTKSFVVFPKQKGAEELKWSQAKDHWRVQYTPKIKWHRYDLHLEDHLKNTVTFTIEPKRK